MSKEAMLKQYGMARGYLLKVLENVTEETADVRPEGFNNTVRWNAGHILEIAEEFFFGFPKTSHIPVEYKKIFGNGTKPADWQAEPPSLATLRTQLHDQVARIQETMEGRLGQPLPKPFSLGSGLDFATYDDVLLVALIHEAMHLGYINAMKRAIGGGAK